MWCYRRVRETGFARENANLSGAKRIQAQELRTPPGSATRPRAIGVRCRFHPTGRVQVQTARFREAVSGGPFASPCFGNREIAREGEERMNATKRNDEDAPGSVHDLRLAALLLDLVERHGRARAAETLGVSYHTLARASASLRLTGRVSDALGRHLLEGSGTDAPNLEKRVADLDRRVESLEENSAEQVGKGVRSEDRDGTLCRLAAELESLTRRVKGLETRHGPPDPLLERVVADEPEPDGETRFGTVAQMVAEWRRRRDVFDASTDDLATLLAERGLLALEIVMTGVCGFTLPPSDCPWDRFQLEDETGRRKRRMNEMREEIRRAKRRRRLRRISTLGVWRR